MSKVWRLTLAILLCGQLIIAFPASASAGDKAVPLVIGETFTIDYRILGETRRINVYAPPGHTVSPNARLPVLYMPDGGLAEDFLHVDHLWSLDSRVCCDVYSSDEPRFKSRAKRLRSSCV